MNEFEYNKEIRELAQAIISEVEEYGGEVYDTACEFVDGHEFIIYCHNNIDVLKHTQNEDAYFDAMGNSVKAESTAQVLTKLAYFAMLQDVMEQIY